MATKKERKTYFYPTIMALLSFVGVKYVHMHIERKMQKFRWYIYNLKNIRRHQ
jgi:hypothetical protein